MIKHYIRYIICLLFVGLFLFKGSVSVLPSLSTLFDQKNIEALIIQEAEDAQKNTEEKKEVELKQYFTPHNYDINFSFRTYNLSAKNIAANNIQCKEDVFLAVSTPPPKLV